MSKNLERELGESKFGHLKRLIYGKLKDKTIDADYVTLAPLIFGTELCESECRKRMYGALYILNQIEDELIENITDDEVLDQITCERLELEKERKKKQTVNLEINRNLRKLARSEMTQDEIKRCISGLKPFNIPPYIQPKTGSKEGILPISDVHYGKKCAIRGLKGEIINEYNEEIFERRMFELFNHVIDISMKEDIEKLNILLTGDLIDGILRMTQLQKLQYGIIDSTIKVAEFLASWLNELSVYIRIDLYSCLGNHSQIRPLGSKNGDFEEENMERVVMWHIKTRLEKNPNINIVENDGDFIYFNCKGLHIMASHGEERNIESAIKDYILLYGEPIDMFIGGHLHTKENKSIGIAHSGLSDVEYCRVKSICSIDDFSTKLRKSSGAGTSLFIIEDGKGKTITYDINLQ